MNTYKMFLYKQAEGGYTVKVPSLPGCITEGDTVEDAVKMGKEAIELYVEVLKEKGEIIPDDKDILEYSLNLETA